LHPHQAPAIPAIGLGLVLGALLLVIGSALTWRRTAEHPGTAPDHGTGMALMTVAMLTAMMAGLWAGVLGLALLGHGGPLAAVVPETGVTHPGLWSATVLGVEVGVLAGLLTGAPGGLTPALEGAAAGLMGGLMGAMLLQMVPESGSPLLSLLLLFWAWAGAGSARLLAPDLSRRWLLLPPAILSALILGVWGPPWFTSR
jgi:hypothetical protein